MVRKLYAHVRRGRCSEFFKRFYTKAASSAPSFVSFSASGGRRRRPFPALVIVNNRFGFR